MPESSATVTSASVPVDSLIQQSQQSLIGRNPFDFINNHLSYGSALNCALYDVMGKYLEVPVYKLNRTEGAGCSAGCSVDPSQRRRRHSETKSAGRRTKAIPFLRCTPAITTT